VRLLLDSNALVWAATDPGRLSPRARNALQDRENDLFVSIASLWELTIKVSRGRLPQAGSSIQYLLDEMREQGYDLLAIRTAHLVALGSLERYHRDPFDRLIIAQSAAESLPVVTNDELFSRYPIQTNEMVRRLIHLREQEDRGGSF
jgi:PIN domain nuclease of toxin-antitoxin system